ncbi:2-phosphosulfolactate phosphatase [Halopiger goleimassiliensis]|uniref:2-phosphosulfolactate phosphatase n=1 Tax=Halopiger goleimassiliensis TaxID=1293048 RepID=UPI000678052C|nr:2-phosphosulfolactate phosphatase [Halopiger goleimassiliensis]
MERTIPDRSFTDRLIDGRDRLPRVPDAGDYVVIDVTHFSTTVAELLGLGARYVHVTDERGDEFAYRESHPETLIGGGKTDDYEPIEGYDFFNSPSYVQELDVEDRPTSMTSKNGGTAVARLRRRGGDDVDVFVGGYTNAAALADHLRTRDRPVYLVSCGSSGRSTMDDHLGAVVVDRYLRDEPLSAAEREQFASLLEASKAPDYADKPEIRRRDLGEYATAINSREVVPKLEDGVLVDVADDGA